jgi:hypothetical protein
VIKVVGTYYTWTKGDQITAERLLDWSGETSYLKTTDNEDILKIEKLGTGTGVPINIINDGTDPAIKVDGNVIVDDAGSIDARNLTNYVQLFIKDALYTDTVRGQIWLDDSEDKPVYRDASTVKTIGFPRFTEWDDFVDGSTFVATDAGIAVASGEAPASAGYNAYVTIAVDKDQTGDTKFYRDHDISDGTAVCQACVTAPFDKNDGVKITVTGDAVTTNARVYYFR